MDVLRFPVFILMTVCGAIGLSSGGLMLLRTYTFLSQAVGAVATVYRAPDGRLHFRFTTRDAQVIELAAMLGTTHYREGEQVEILYRPADPYDARVRREFNWWLLPLIIAVLGIALLVAGVTGLTATLRMFDH